MKKPFYALLLFPILVFGQIEVDNNWKNAINPIFQNLDKTKIQSGMLLDYAMEFTDVTAYNGVLTDTTYIDANVLGNIYKTLFMSKVFADTTHTPLFDKYAYNWARERHNATKDSAGIYILSGLLYEYQTLNENALAQNKITVTNNKYYDKYISGVWQNPYETKKTFALTPPVLHSRSKDVYFKLPNELFLSNLKNQIANIQIDVDNGQGYQNLPFDTAINLEFYDNKIHDLSFKVTLTNSQVLYCRSKFKIDDSLLDKDQPQARGAIVVNDERVYIHEDGNFFNAAWLTIRRIPGNAEITRPLILAEGLDTGNFTAPEDFGGERTLRNFNRSLLNSGQLFNILRDGTNDYDLIYIDWVRGMADLPDNSRVLEEIIAWVNEQKALSNSTEPNVLLGQSMGGVIGRYTLARMENENKPHDVRLFIAHDSPMQGANTPLAFQHFSAHMKEEYVSSPIIWAVGEVLIPIGLGLAQLGEDFLNAFGGNNNNNIPTYVSPAQLLSLQDQTASRQLNYWSAFSTVYGNHTQTQTYSQSWQQTLETMGWPTLSRNIAISNGNECGVNNGFAPGAPLLIIDSRSNPGFLLDMLNVVLAPAVGAITLDLGLIVVGVIPGRSRWQTNLDFNSYGTTGSQNRIYRGRIRFEKKVLWIGPTINYDLTNRSYYAPQQALPFDTYSGGRFNFLDNQGNFALEIPILGDLVNLQNDFYGFIPTVSALDIRKTNGNTPTPDDYLKSYSGGMPADSNLQSGFDAFIVDNLPNQPFNNEHISFQVRNGNWLADELNAQTPADFPILDNCNFVCDSESVSISGISQFCTGSRTYTVMSGADTYQWQVVPEGTPINDDPLLGNVSITSATNLNSITLTHTGNRSGWYNLRVIINSDVCGVQNLLLTKRIYIGAPTVESISVVSETEAGPHISPSINDCDIPLRLNFDPDNNDITDIEWQKVTTDILWSRDFTNNFNRYVYLYPECNKEFKFKVRAKNSCGFWSPWRELTYNITECWNTCQPSTGNIVSNNFILYPIPANNILNFGVVENPTWNFPSSSPFVNLNDLDPGAPITVTYPKVKLYISFYSSVGTLVHSTIIQGLPNQIDVSSLLSGNYIMIIEYLGQIETHNIQII